jgi:predicted nucleic acid-binding protein
MKAIIFDSGPIITLTLNNLMWILDPLKKQFDGEFYIPEMVKEELIDRPLKIDKFKFEALHTLSYIRGNTLKLYQDKAYQDLSKQVSDICNSLYTAHGNYIDVVHKGELETLSLAIHTNATAIVIDERSTREIIEEPHKLCNHLSRKLHTKVELNSQNLKKLKELIGDIKVIRSVELVVVAYKMGLLDRYLPEKPFNEELLLDAVLWGLKLNGCAVNFEEIHSIINMLR